VCWHTLTLSKKSWHTYAPGKKFDYSNIGATTAAHVCECLAKKYLQEREREQELVQRRNNSNSKTAMIAPAQHDDETTLFLAGYAAADVASFDSLARAMFQTEWNVTDVGYKVADLPGLDIAIPCKHIKKTNTFEVRAQVWCVLRYGTVSV
jgi:hypothetical protein